MKKWLIVTSVLFAFGILFLILGSYIFSLSVREFDDPIRIFGFFLAICDLIAGLILTVLAINYSKQFERDVEHQEESKLKKYVKDSINYFYFAFILIVLVLILLIFGLKFLSSNEWYWRLYSGFIAVATSMLISYAPSHEIIKNKIYSTSYVYLLITFIILIIILIIVFGF